jgi:hypothetical protein
VLSDVHSVLVFCSALYDQLVVAMLCVMFCTHNQLAWNTTEPFLEGVVGLAVFEM